MVVNKWNFKLHKYEDIEISDKCALFETDMEKLIKCANCSKEVKYGQTYTSRQYHNDIGLGYAVCEDCYKKEREIERKYMEDIRNMEGK